MTETGTHTCVFQDNSQYSYQQGKEIKEILGKARKKCIMQILWTVLFFRKIATILTTHTLPRFLRCIMNIIITHHLCFSAKRGKYSKLFVAIALSSNKLLPQTLKLPPQILPNCNIK